MENSAGAGRSWTAGGGRQYRGHPAVLKIALGSQRGQGEARNNSDLTHLDFAGEAAPVFVFENPRGGIDETGAEGLAVFSVCRTRRKQRPTWLCHWNHSQRERWWRVALAEWGVCE